MVSGKVLAKRRAGSSDIKAVHEKVAAMTRQLFGGDVNIRLEPDPEVPINYFVVYAEAHGDVEDLIKLDHQWHRLLRETIKPDGERYCLSLVLK